MKIKELFLQFVLITSVCAVCISCNEDSESGVSVSGTTWMYSTGYNHPLPRNNPYDLVITTMEEQRILDFDKKTVRVYDALVEKTSPYLTRVPGISYELYYESMIETNYIIDGITITINGYGTFQLISGTLWKFSDGIPEKALERLL